MSKARSHSRRCAVQAIYMWQITGNELSAIDEKFVLEHDMSKLDLEYFRELLHGVPTHRLELDDEFMPLLDRKIAEVDPVERAIIRIGVYELKYRLDVPYRVVINESVELAKVFGAEHGHKYVNSILDGVARKVRATEMAAKK